MHIRLVLAAAVDPVAALAVMHLVASVTAAFTAGGAGPADCISTASTGIILHLYTYETRAHAHSATSFCYAWLISLFVVFAQIALFVFPFTVLVAWVMGQPLTMAVQPLSAVVMLLSVLVAMGRPAMTV